MSKFILVTMRHAGTGKDGYAINLDNVHMIEREEDEGCNIYFDADERNGFFEASDSFDEVIAKIAAVNKLP